jgi:hypothetical protein
MSADTDSSSLVTLGPIGAAGAGGSQCKGSTHPLGTPGAGAARSTSERSHSPQTRTPLEPYTPPHGAPAAGSAADALIVYAAMACPGACARSPFLPLVPPPPAPGAPAPGATDAAGAAAEVAAAAAAVEAMAAAPLGPGGIGEDAARRPPLALPARVFPDGAPPGANGGGGAAAAAAALVAARPLKGVRVGVFEEVTPTVAAHALLPCVPPQPSRCAIRLPLPGTFSTPAPLSPLPVRPQWFNDADAPVAAAARAGLDVLASLGATVTPVRIPELEQARVAAALVILCELFGVYRQVWATPQLREKVRLGLQQGRGAAALGLLHLQGGRCRTSPPLAPPWRARPPPVPPPPHLPPLPAPRRHPHHPRVRLAPGGRPLLPGGPPPCSALCLGCPWPVLP